MDTVRKSLLQPAFVLLLVLLFASSCASAEDDDATSSAVDASAEATAEAVDLSDREFATTFVDRITHDFDIDYTALESAGDAIERADLVVVGRISSIGEGLSVYAPEGLFEQRTTVTVRVDEVISGTMLEGPELNVQMFRSPLVSVDELAETLPQGEAVFILEDITTWRPLSEARFEYPEGMSEKSVIYAPYADGIWFRTEQEPVGYYASFEEITTRWPGVTDYQAMLDTLRESASTK